MPFAPGEICWIQESGGLALSALGAGPTNTPAKRRRVQLFDGWPIRADLVLENPPKDRDLLRPITSHVLVTWEKAIGLQAKYPHLVLTISDARQDPALRGICSSRTHHLVSKPQGIRPFGRAIDSFDWSMAPSQVHGVQERGAAFLGHDLDTCADFFRLPSGRLRVVYSPAAGDFDEFMVPGRHRAQQRCAAIARLRWANRKT